MSEALDISTRSRTCRLVYRTVVAEQQFQTNGEAALLSFAWRLFSSSEVPWQISNVQAVYCAIARPSTCT